MENPLWVQSATVVVQLLRDKKVTPLQLIDVAEARIKENDTIVNAVPTLCFERARRQAHELAQRPVPHTPGPGYLFGLPIVVKDLTAVEGVRFTEGSLLHKDRIAEHSDPLVEVLEANGAIIIGKSNTPEFGAGGNTFNEVFGVTRNPWDTRKTAGGSSGGSAAALAAGQAWLATGSDLGGSLRIPAAFCGVVGMRPSPGVVLQRWAPKAPPSGADAGGVAGLDGPMARSVGDLALALDAMAARHPRDPHSPLPPAQPFAVAAAAGAALARQNRRWRVGFTPDLGGIAPVEPETAALCRAAAQRCRELGAQVADACPDLHDAAHVFQVLRAAWFVDAAPLLREPARSVIKAELVWQIEAGLRLTESEVAAAVAAQAALCQRVDAFFESHDFLLCPVTMVAPFDAEVRWVQEVQGVRFSNYSEWLLMTSSLSLAPVPALSLPVALTGNGLPVGLQIVGPPGGDAAVIELAAALERLIGTPVRPEL
ncbi:hypothetical protein WJX81_005853 [Elliptochloris bilobata]|uniref:Amidase domain-containing protein n=1 Tax=Elliptochloris bilobata TaxID=381761 RepID=A0AAW1QWL7_9CHLO